MEFIMKIEERLPLPEDILEKWKDEIGEDFADYKNHVCRMINFCFTQNDFKPK